MNCIITINYIPKNMESHDARLEDGAIHNATAVPCPVPKGQTAVKETQAAVGGNLSTPNVSKALAGLVPHLSGLLHRCSHLLLKLQG